MKFKVGDFLIYEFVKSSGPKVLFLVDSIDTGSNNDKFYRLKGIKILNGRRTSESNYYDPYASWFDRSNAELFEGNIETLKILYGENK